MYFSDYISDLLAEGIPFNKTLIKARNNGLKCKEMCTVLLKPAETFSLAASQLKSLASHSADHFLVRLMVAGFHYWSKKTLYLLQTDFSNDN